MYLGDFVTPHSGGLNGPGDLVFGPDGHLYVGNSRTDSVLRYDGRTGAVWLKNSFDVENGALTSVAVIRIIAATSNKGRKAWLPPCRLPLSPRAFLSLLFALK